MRQKNLQGKVENGNGSQPLQQEASVQPRSNATFYPPVLGTLSAGAVEFPPLYPCIMIFPPGMEFDWGQPRPQGMFC